MIKTQNLTPEIYYNQSRDFQFFGRVYDIIFNYVKTNVDLMENFPINNFTDSKLIELLARTLGFNNRLSYRNDDLNAICNVFIKLIKEKGSIKAIHTLVKTILNVEGINKKYAIIEPSEDSLRNVITIRLPDVITNPEIKLFEEVLEYILPIGMCYNIKTTTVIDQNTTEIEVNQAARSANLSNDEKEYSNLTIARDGSRMVTSGETESTTDIGHFGDMKNPRVGDIRYSRVVDKLKGD